MSKGFVDIGISLDGFFRGPHCRPGNPLGDGGLKILESAFHDAIVSTLATHIGYRIRR